MRIVLERGAVDFWAKCMVICIPLGIALGVLVGVMYR